MTRRGRGTCRWHRAGLEGLPCRPVAPTEVRRPAAADSPQPHPERSRDSRPHSWRAELGPISITPLSPPHASIPTSRLQPHLTPLSPPHASVHTSCLQPHLAPWPRGQGLPDLLQVTVGVYCSRHMGEKIFIVPSAWDVAQPIEPQPPGLTVLFNITTGETVLAPISHLAALMDCFGTAAGPPPPASWQLSPHRIWDPRGPPCPSRPLPSTVSLAGTSRDVSVYFFTVPA